MKALGMFISEEISKLSSILTCLSTKTVANENTFQNAPTYPVVQVKTFKTLLSKQSPKNMKLMYFFLINKKAAHINQSKFIRQYGKSND